jgi:hypothetical protein
MEQCSRVLPEKLKRPNLLKKFAAFYPQHPILENPQPTLEENSVN